MGQELVVAVETFDGESVFAPSFSIVTIEMLGANTLLNRTDSESVI